MKNNKINNTIENNTIGEEIKMTNNIATSINAAENKLLAAFQLIVRNAAIAYHLDPEKAIAEIGSGENLGVIAVRLAKMPMNGALKLLGGKQELQKFCDKMSLAKRGELKKLEENGYSRPQIKQAMKSAFFYSALVGKKGDINAVGWFTKWVSFTLSQSWSNNRDASDKHYLKGSDLKAGMKDLLNFISAGIEQIGTITNAFDCATTMRLYSKLLRQAGYEKITDALDSDNVEIRSWGLAMEVVCVSGFRRRDEDHETVAAQAAELGANLPGNEVLIHGESLIQLKKYGDYKPVLKRVPDPVWGEITVCSKLEEAAAVIDQILHCDLNKLTNVALAFEELEGVKRFYGENSIDACKKFPEAGLPIPGFVFMMNTKKASKMPWGVKLNFKEFRVDVTGVTEDSHSELKVVTRHNQPIDVDGETGEAIVGDTKVISAPEKAGHKIVMKSWYKDMYQTLRRSTEPALVAYGQKLLKHIHDNNMDYPDFVMDKISEAMAKFPDVATAMERVIVDRGAVIRQIQNELDKAAAEFGEDSEEYKSEADQAAKQISAFNKAAANHARVIYQAPYVKGERSLFPEEAIYVALGVSMKRFEAQKERLAKEAEEAALELDAKAKLLEAYDDGVDVSERFDFKAGDEREQLVAAYEAAKKASMDAYARIDASAISDFARTAMPNEWAVFCLLTEWQRTTTTKPDGTKYTEGTFNPCISIDLEEGVPERAQGWCLEFVDGIAEFKGQVIAKMTEHPAPNGRFIIDFVEDEEGNRKPVAAIPLIFLARQSVTFARPDDGMIVRVLASNNEDVQSDFGGDYKAYFDHIVGQFEENDGIAFRNAQIEAKRKQRRDDDNRNVATDGNGKEIARFYAAASKYYTHDLVGFRGHVIEGQTCTYTNPVTKVTGGCAILAVQGEKASKPNFASFEFSDIK